MGGVSPVGGASDDELFLTPLYQFYEIRLGPTGMVGCMREGDMPRFLQLKKGGKVINTGRKQVKQATY